MINLENLEEFVIKYINTNKSSIIYIGGGTYCYSGNLEDNVWRFDKNQQFPLFLRDFKSKNPQIPILIILIDPVFDLNITPYIVNSTDQFYSGSWEKSKINSNHYHSKLDIDVIVISDRIVWGENLQREKNNYFNFENLMVNLCDKVSELKSNTLMFYHEFTGLNVLELEHLIKQKTINFNPNKICIDITRGSDMSCYFNLSNPEFYPVIEFNEFNEFNKLKYSNTNVLSNDAKTYIIRTYKKFTDGFEIPDSTCKYYPYKPNYLFATNPNIIMCFQIIKYDKIIFKLISDGLIPLIRYLYVCTDNTNFNNKIWGISHFNKLKIHINNFSFIHNYDYKNDVFLSDRVNLVDDNIKLIELINSNINDNPDYNEIISHLKENVICGLFDIIKNILVNILIKYEINVIVVEDFIDNLKQLENKYNMIPLYKNFISNLNI
jgi:hypothetical protein